MPSGRWEKGSHAECARKSALDLTTETCAGGREAATIKSIKSVIIWTGALNQSHQHVFSLRVCQLFSPMSYFCHRQCYNQNFSCVEKKTLILCAIDHLESSKRKEGEGKKQEKETNQPRKVVQNTLKCSNKPALWSKGAGWCLCHTVKKMWVEQKASWAKKQEEKQSASVRLCKINGKYNVKQRCRRCTQVS